MLILLVTFDIERSILNPFHRNVDILSENWLKLDKAESVLYRYKRLAAKPVFYKRNYTNFL